MSPAEAVERAILIDGWMTAEELDWLAHTAAQHESIVEVGSWQGRSTKALALMCPGIVFSVDSLQGETIVPVEDLDRLFRANLADEIATGKVRIVRKPSLAAAATFTPGSVSMVFIDGDHDAPAPAQDIAAWAPVGGLICGHDRSCPGVAAALAEHDWAACPGDLWALL